MTLRQVPLVALVLSLAACGGGGAKSAGDKKCDIRGDASFPLLDSQRRHSVNVETNLGQFAIRLDVAEAPCVASSFAALVRRHYFDKTIFHRIVPGFVIQGGDPSGTGAGGPGYTVVEAPPASSRYTEGVVAMAKSSAEPPGAAGSQFFVVTAKNAGLPPDYAILGTVTEGLNVVRRIGRLGNPVTERPTQRVVVRRMMVM